MSSPTGMVLSIERCSLHDGPGIRTTVFLKGCPLKCAWCHNPESQAPGPELQFFTAKCTYCGTCVSACPGGVHAVDGTKSGHLLDRSRCTLCGKCVNACMQDALKISGKTMSADDVMAEVDADRIYYDESGGGITLSGGEPLFQPGFSAALLEESRKRGIHTCVETSGFVPGGTLGRILPLVDLFLFDYKATGERRHRELTGVNPGRILSNLDLLARHEKPVILRCPMIPGVNDTPDHLAAIAGLSKTHENIQAVELMAYHEYARDKYRRIGRDCGLAEVKSPDDAVTGEWIRTLKKSGCRDVRQG